MQIKQTARFLQELETIIDFIAQDSVERALGFQDALIQEIYRLPKNPYICRKSTKANDENIRDLIYKGYVIPFRINLEKEQIEILGVFNQNLWEEKYES